MTLGISNILHGRLYEYLANTKQTPVCVSVCVFYFVWILVGFWFSFKRGKEFDVGQVLGQDLVRIGKEENMTKI